MVKADSAPAGQGFTYYEALVRAGGLTGIGNNPYGIKEGTYYFAMDGRMILS